MHTDFGYFEEDKLGKPYDVRLLGRLYPFAAPYKFLLLCSMILVVFITLFDLAVPYITKIAIDQYIVPAINSGKTKSEKATENETRYYRVDLTDPEINKIVHKYQKLFKVDGSFALIAFDNLSKLEKKDRTVLRKEDFKGVAFAACILLAVTFFTFGLNYLQRMIIEYAGQMIMHDIRLKLFSHIQSLAVSFFTRNPVGRLVTRATNDVQNMHELFTSFISFVFKDFFLLLGIITVLISIDWKLAIACFTVLPFVLYAAFDFSIRSREAFRALRIKIAEINSMFSETVGGIKVVQLFMQEKKNYRDFAKLNHENYLAGMQQIHIFSVFMPLIELMGSVAVAVVIYYGGSGVLSKTISLGDLVAFISYMKMFFWPIRDIAEKYNIMQNAMASAERIFLILDSKEKLPQPEKNAEAESLTMGKIKELSFKDVSFGYVADEPVLKKITFVVHAGETVAVVGETGTGKTTLLNLIFRFYDPTSGRVLINGMDIRNPDISAVRSKMAIVTQEPFLFSGTLRDNIFCGNDDLSEKEMERIIELSNCKFLVNKLPAGLDTVLAESGKSISSGERQLICIARAFARNPDLIILDEATSYIDSETELKIQSSLSNLMKNRTSLIIAHRLSTAQSADRIIVLNRGQIVETGPHDELMKKKGFYYRLNQFQR
jgi:ATP-binding cassette subfamily B multidrug efflux pump